MLKENYQASKAACLPFGCLRDDPRIPPHVFTVSNRTGCLYLCHIYTYGYIYNLSSPSTYCPSVLFVSCFEKYFRFSSMSNWWGFLFVWQNMDNKWQRVPFRLHFYPKKTHPDLQNEISNFTPLHFLILCLKSGEVGCDLLHIIWHMAHRAGRQKIISTKGWSFGLGKFRKERDRKWQ